eukprot:TRINITY_DN11136_c0_g1_i1.p1 TRINITY_DN11136_c0_g1~~TRINITY_DN11136_c0_g1_i1.p1  ORF type:complete len:462 (-),score=69.35 TRINITY_DN11136_c0_g1_i1:44-1393(-)
MSQLQVLERQDLGFRIEYPSDWFLISPFLFDTSFVFSPVPTPKQEPTILLQVIDFVVPTSLKDFTEQKAQTFKEGATAQKEGDLAGLPAIKVKIRILESECFQIWTVQNERRAFVIVYTALKDKFSASLNIVFKMLTSLKLFTPKITLLALAPYINDRHTFSLKTPFYWEISEDKGTAVSTWCPSRPNNKLVARLHVKEEALPPNINSLDEYLKYVTLELEKMLVEISKIKKDVITVDSQEAIRLRYTNNAINPVCRYTQLFFQRDQKVFIITFLSNEEEQDNSQHKVFERILASFKFTKNLNEYDQLFVYENLSLKYGFYFNPETLDIQPDYQLGSIQFKLKTSPFAVLNPGSRKFDGTLKDFEDDFISQIEVEKGFKFLSKHEDLLGQAKHPCSVLMYKSTDGTLRLNTILTVFNGFGITFRFLALDKGLSKNWALVRKSIDTLYFS